MSNTGNKRRAQHRVFLLQRLLLPSITRRGRQGRARVIIKSGATEWDAAPGVPRTFGGLAETWPQGTRGRCPSEKGLRPGKPAPGRLRIGSGPANGSRTRGRM